MDSLIDLDAMPLGCHSKATAAVVAEAIRCYRGGAFRASIVMTWIAVVADFMEKLGTLSAQGDAGAERCLKELATARAANNTLRLQEWEASSLARAVDFEFIGPGERTNLERLRDDRHACAHPSTDDDGTLRSISPELARAHLRHAYESLFSKLPVQGKAALARLHAEVESEHFPESVERAERVLRGGPLARPKEALLANFLKSTVAAVDDRRGAREFGEVHR